MTEMKRLVIGDETYEIVDAQSRTNIADHEGRITAVEESGSGAPTPTALAANMIDTNRVYLYTGTEEGYIAGDWYYYNGSVWVDGGKYGSFSIRQGVTPLLITILRHALYANDQADNISALETLLTGLEPISVTGISLDINSISDIIGNTYTLTATIEPFGADDQEITWSSSNPSVATVNDGVVTLVASGSAIITVTTHDGGYTATCSVTVTDYPALTFFTGANPSYISARKKYGLDGSAGYNNTRACAFLTEQYNDAVAYYIYQASSHNFPDPAYPLYIPNGATKITVNCPNLCCAINVHKDENGVATQIDSGHWSSVGGETDYDLSSFIESGATHLSIGFKNNDNTSLVNTTIDNTTVTIAFS